MTSTMTCDQEVLTVTTRLDVIEGETQRARLETEAGYLDDWVIGGPENLIGHFQDDVRAQLVESS